jgi:two-component system, NtrC family, sensor kinase
MKTLLRLVVFAVLAAGLWLLYRETLGVDPAQRERVASILNDLRQIDAQWDVHVLRSKTGLDKNYDPLTQPQISALQVLETWTGKLAAVDYRLSDSEAKLKEALVAKIDLVDRFKSQNAILRNSLRFVPLAAEDLKTKAREAADSTPAKRAEMAALIESVDQVLIDTLKLETARDAELNSNLRRRVGKLVERRGEYPKALGDSFDTFLNHVATISAQKEREDELLEQLGRVAVADRIEAVDRGFMSAFERMLGKRENYRLMLYIYAGFLLALIAFLLGRGSRPEANPAA